MSFSRLAADLLKRNTTASPVDLGVMRCWVFGLLFVHYVRHDFAAFARLPTVLWRPPFWLRSLSMEFFEPARVEALHVAWLVLLAFACIGLWVRISSLGALLVGVILLWFENTIAYANAKDVLIIWAMYALAVLSTPDQFSVDRLLFRRRFADASRGAMLDKGESLAIYFVRAMLALMFCCAALSKLRTSGIHWGTNGTLANLCASKALTWDRSPRVPGLAEACARHPMWGDVLARGVLPLELSAPLVLVSEWARRLVAPALFVMLASFWLVLGISFPMTLVCFVFFLRFSDEMELPVSDRTGTTGPPRVVFDAGSRWCRAWVRCFEKKAVSKSLELTPADDARADALLRDADVLWSRGCRWLLLRGDTAYRGSTAFIEILAIMGGVWRLGCLLYLIPLCLRDPLSSRRGA
jgi:predicted DCC family thiol-disulfide oxidoreductase YuxK